MPEATQTASTSHKPKSRAHAGASGVEPEQSAMPPYEPPKFELPKFEMPAAFRELAEQGVSQAKDNWERIKSATDDATDIIEMSYARASKGAADYGLKLIEATRHNADAAFDYATELMTAKSVSEVIELSTSHMRKQFDAFSSQAKELAALAQKVTTDTVEPLREGVSKAFRKAA